MKQKRKQNAKQIVKVLGLMILAAGLLSGCGIAEIRELRADRKELSVREENETNPDKSNPEVVQEGEQGMASYKSITMEEAKAIFATAGDYRIVDVRRPDEYADGHIPGAINVANESIGTTVPETLPDLTKVTYVYCRSGRRSKDAAGKLAAIGYTNIIECGGILDWTGAVEK